MSASREAFVRSLGFEPDTFQLTAMDSLDAGASVLVAAPTGSGKTLVAEYAVHRAVGEYKRAFYTAPIKALSNQKYRDLCELWGAERVGLLTGDNAVNADAPVVVMTTEVLRNMIYGRSHALDDLAVVVLDEVHHAGDERAWGDGVRTAFEHAHRRLCVSGTPFRNHCQESGASPSAVASRITVSPSSADRPAGCAVSVGASCL